MKTPTPVGGIRVAAKRADPKPDALDVGAVDVALSRHGRSLVDIQGDIETAVAVGRALADPDQAAGVGDSDGLASHDGADGGILGDPHQAGIDDDVAEIHARRVGADGPGLSGAEQARRDQQTAQQERV